MPDIFTEGPQLSDVLLYENEGDRYSRETVTLAAGGGLLTYGQLLARRSADGQMLPPDPAATDGSQTPVAVLIEPADASLQAAEAVALVRHATVKRQGLTYGPHLTSQEDRDAADASLAAAGILIREGA